MDAETYREEQEQEDYEHDNSNVNNSYGLRNKKQNVKRSNHTSNVRGRNVSTRKAGKQVKDTGYRTASSSDRKTSTKRKSKKSAGIIECSKTLIKDKVCDAYDRISTSVCRASESARSGYSVASKTFYDRCGRVRRSMTPSTWRASRETRSASIAREFAGCCTSKKLCDKHKRRICPPYQEPSACYKKNALCMLVVILVTWLVTFSYVNRHYVKLYGPIELLNSINPFNAGGSMYNSKYPDATTNGIYNPNLLPKILTNQQSASSASSSPPPSEGMDALDGKQQQQHEEQTTGEYNSATGGDIPRCGWCDYFKSYIVNVDSRACRTDYAEDRRTEYASGHSHRSGQTYMSGQNVNDDLLETAIQAQLRQKYLLARDLHSKVGVLKEEVTEIKSMQSSINTQLEKTIIELKEWKITGNNKFNKLENSALSVKETDAAVPYYHTQKVEKMIKRSIALFAADKLGMVDYALESSGAAIVQDGYSKPYTKKSILHSFFGIPYWYSGNPVESVIRPETNPGDCWALEGNRGYVTVQLSVPVMVTSVSLEHIPQSISLPGSHNSAPKDFIVLGLSDINDRNPVELGVFTYIEGSSPIQNFKIKKPRSSNYPAVRLQVLNNHGNSDYTCIYRFRVHSNSRRSP